MIHTRVPMFTLRPLTAGMLGAGALVLAGLGLFGHDSRAADTAKPSAPKPALSVSIAQPRQSTLPLKLSANGSVMAWQEASVGADANGMRVQELHAAIGDHVKAGQLLATFAAEGVQADVALARAALAEATANAAEASANADRARAVQGTGALSAQQINQYLTAELAAKARVDSAKAQLDTQMLRLKNTRLLAPDAGIISARTSSVGVVVGPGAEMFRLIRQSRLEWRAEVTSAELGRITVGMPVLVTSPSGVSSQGRVRMVAPTVDVATRNGTVYVDLIGTVAGGKASAGAFKPGMFARGEFNVGSSTALTVPQSAVVVRDGFSYVMRVSADSRVTQLKVQSGRVLGDQIEVIGSIQPQDRLVASGGSFLSEGDLVKVVGNSKPNTASTPANAAQAAIK